MQDSRARIAELEAENTSLRAAITGLRAENASLRTEHARLRTENASLRGRLEAIERRLALNSSNSGKPPSSDSPADRKARPKKEPTGRRPGGQPGHKGHKRVLVEPERVSRTEHCFPDNCRRCGGRLRRVKEEHPLRHQVIEIPVIEPDVTEYQQHRVTCQDCGHVTCAPLPDDVPTGMCGPRLMGLIGLLTALYQVSRRKATTLLSDVLNVEISLGALSECEGRVSEAVAEPVEQARTFASEQAVKNVDATGWLQGGQPRTLWTVATTLVTAFTITLNATGAELRKLFKRRKGIVVSDRAPQFAFWAIERRQICWAHLIRKFASFAQEKGKAGELGHRLLNLSRSVFHLWHNMRDGTCSAERFKDFIKCAKPLLEQMLEEGQGGGVPGVAGSCRNILEHRSALWTFLEVEGVPPTNNHAEQELRAFVLWRKRSFGSQSDRGTLFAERMMTVTHTLRKQRRHVLSYLAEACTAKLRNMPPPSLLPATP